MATICAGRCFLSHISSSPEALYTFGSPRVGNKRYVHHVDLDHHLLVNNNDIVNRVTPTWFGYRHTGEVMYLDSSGVHRQMSPVARARDRWRGFWKGLRKGRFDHLADHRMTGYIDGISATLKQDEDSQSSRTD